MRWRVAVVVVGLAVAGWAVVRVGDVRGCKAAGDAAFRVASASAAADVTRRIDQHCRGATVPASAAVVLSRRGHPQDARRLLARAIAQEPLSTATWVAAGIVAREADDRAGLAQARSRLRTLDPTNQVLSDRG